MTHGDGEKRRGTRRGRWILRLLGAGLMLAGLMGPTPGNVGGCGSGPQVADPVQHCRDKSFWLCRRDQFAMRTDEPTFRACLQPIESSCAGRVWPAGCMPTPAQSDACIMLLQRGDLASLTNEQIESMYPDCRLCP